MSTTADHLAYGAGYNTCRMQSGQAKTDCCVQGLLSNSILVTQVVTEEGAFGCNSLFRFISPHPS